MKDKVNLKDIFKYFVKGHPDVKKFWKKKANYLAEIYDLEEHGKYKEESEDEEEVKTFKNVKTPVQVKKTTNKDINQNKILNKKKERKDSTSESEESEEEKPPVKIAKKNESAVPQNVPFKRIDNSLKEVLPTSLQDNSYDTFATKTGDDYGKQANEKLKFTKGRDFKKEKTKFKNKTAFGGINISTQVRSIKLDDDSN